MNKFITGTAVGLLMSMTPALAQDTDLPADDARTPPAASEETLPSDIAPPEIMEEPADPAGPIPDRSSEIAPPEDGVMPPLPKASELEKPMDHPEETIEDSASLDQPIFGAKQEPDQWLASNMIGQSVVNSDNDSIGHINDVVTNENGEIAAVLIGVGGFLGIGEKEVAVRYEDLTINRDEAQNVTVVTPLTSEMLASAPDYERLSEQSVTVGENTSVIEKDEERLPSDPGVY
jgi:hypothetical protein